jgi:UDPglucose 6-dehydrogenase
VGTAELMRSILRRERGEGVDFDLVANPEFLREGQGLHDFFYPDRVVIGTSSDRAARLIAGLYAPIIDGKGEWAIGGQMPAGRPVPVVQTDLASAQMIKHAANAFLATRISFINEIAGICERVGADIGQVVQGIGYDKRIGHGYLSPGLGFGGPCLEKDLSALIRVAIGNGFVPGVLSSVLERNARQVESVIAKLKAQTGYLLYKKRIAVWGLAFKAGTNDVRNSLALRVVERLLEEGASVRAHDPIAMPEAKAALPSLTYCDDPYDACDRADGLLILTEWPQFKQIDFARLKKAMVAPCIVDARNLLDAPATRAAGFAYAGIGRH